MVNDSHGQLNENIRAPVASVQAAATEILAYDSPSRTMLLVKPEEAHVLLVRPLIPFQRRVEGFTIPLRARIICPTWDLSGDGRPFPLVLGIELNEQLILIR